LIKEENSKDHPYKLGVNQFADMTDEEYKQTLNFYMDTIDKVSLEGEEIFKSEKEYQMGEVIVDHTQYFGDIKDQGICGSCYSFATNGAVEANYAKKFGAKIILSEQQIVDCNPTTSACCGGNMGLTLDFLRANGAMRQSDYPYTSGKTELPTDCIQTSQTPVYRIVKGQKTCSNCAYSDWQALIKDGPIIVSINMDAPELKLYKSGIVNPTSCGDYSNHAVIAVALQKDDQGDYVVLRNSWGSSWGEKGYFKVRINLPSTCFVTLSATLPLLVQGDDPSSNPQPVVPKPEPVPDCPTLFKTCYFYDETLQMCQSVNDLGGIGWSGVAKAFKIGKATKAQFFSSKNCVGNYGKEYSLSSNEKCFDEMTDWTTSYSIARAQSVAIIMEDPPAGCIWVFQDACYTGGKQEFCNHIPDLGAYYGMNDAISSIRLGKGVVVSLFIDPNYLGSSWGINKDYAGFEYPMTSLNDAVSSIRIYKS
jgi:hypothetical protein